MRKSDRRIRHSLVALTILLNVGWMARELSIVSGSSAQETARTGPATEKRFPPLKLPPGFKATLFACDPLVEYPSAVALGPCRRALKNSSVPTNSST